MKSQIMPTLFVRLRSHWARRRSLILESGLLLLTVVLAAVSGWQLSARFVASAKSAKLRAIVSSVPVAAEPLVPVGGGCNNCCGSWSQKSNTGPTARDISAVAYAQACNRVVLFGGRAAGGVPPANVTDETWEWNGTTMTWAQFAPATRPAARGQHAMAYDAARQQIVLFGGFNANFGGLNDTWVYDCGSHTWTQKFPANSPSIRHGHAMAYDPNNQVVVMYGGGDNKEDTWTWDGTNWTQISATSLPGIRHEHAMAFDGFRVILFGGSKNAGNADNDTWGFTGTGWTQLAANGTGPNKRYRHAMAQEPGCQKVILFGGSADGLGRANDTWEWNGTTLSWCQTTVPTPPSVREYPAMVYDGKGAIAFGGQASNLSQLGDTWRFGCGSRSYTYRAGLMDNFRPPFSATSPRADFLAAVNTVYNTPTRKNFDDPTSDRFLLHSFTGLPANIVKAELEVRMRPESGSTDNDSIHLDFPSFSPPSFTWGQNMRTLHPNGTWDAGQGVYTFMLDLCDLPAGSAGQPTNLIGLLNTHRSLHVMIQDDTNVDYMKLRVTTCPPRVRFAGLPHEPFNDTSLELITSPTGVEQLQINPSPAARTDVKTVLGQVSGWQANLLPVSDLRQTGKVLESWVKGRVGGVDDQFIGKSSITGNGNSATFTADFSNIGSPTSLVELLDPNGQLVGSFTAPNAAAIQFMCPAGTQTLTVCRTEWVCESNGDQTKVTFCDTTCVDFGGQNYANVSTMRVTALGITQPREFVSEGVICGVNLGPLTLTGESVQVGNRFVQALGVASFEPFAGNLAVAGIGSSGQDGALINLGRAESYSLSVDDLDPMGTAPIGASVQVSTTMIPNLLPPPPPKEDFITVTRVLPSNPGFTNQYEIAADFSQLGAASVRVLAFNGATQVAEIPNFTGKVLTSAWPVAVARTWGFITAGYQLDFLDGTIAGFEPCTPAPCAPPLNITSLRVLPQNPSVTNFSILTQSRWTFHLVPEFTVTGLTITPFCVGTISLSPASLANGILGAAYNQTITASGGIAPYRFTITAGTLNAGLSLDSLTGRISGMPTSAGPSTFTVTATDDNGCTGSLEHILTVTECSVITVNPATLVNGAVGAVYNQTFTASGGSGPYSFTRVNGTLPPGLTLATSGAITGTPTQAGTFNFTVQATDANGCQGTRAYPLTIDQICPTITVNPANPLLPPGQVGTAYNQTFTQSGGAGSLTWIISAGAAPAGLTLNPTTGAFTGTPTAAGTFNFTVKATDANGCMGTRNYSLTIGCVTVTVNPASIPNGFVGTAYNQMFTASGGTGPYTFARVTGTLPPGLTLASSGALTGTPTTAGTFNFTVQATDANGCFGERGYTVVIGGSGLQFYPLPTTVRALETRPGFNGCTAPGAPILANTSLTLAMRTGCTGIPADATAVTGNITVVPQYSAGGYLTLFPSNAEQPVVANSNFKPNEVTNNVFTVGLGPADGAFKIFASATTDVIVDVTGYFAPPSPTGLYFHPLNEPVRLVETRTLPGLTGCIKPGAPFPAGATLVQGRSPVAAPCNVIPDTAQVLVGNATTIFPSAGGFLTIYSSDAIRPLAANSNFAGGDVINGPFAVKLGADGKFNVFTPAATELVIDILGYYSADAVDANGAGLLFTILPKPIRELETRPDFPGFALTGCFRPNAPIQGGAGGIRTQQIWGTCDGINIPNVARAMMGNVTVVNPAPNPIASGFLTHYPGNVVTPPTVATSNYPIPVIFGYNRFFVVGLSPADGTFKMFTSTTTDVILDVSGYFAP